MLTFADVTINVCWLYMLTIFSDDDLTLMALLMSVLMMACVISLVKNGIRRSISDSPNETPNMMCGWTCPCH